MPTSSSVSIKSSEALACALVAVALLPGCGGMGDEYLVPGSEEVAEALRVLERRVGGLERQLRELREEIESRPPTSSPRATRPERTTRSP